MNLLANKNVAVVSNTTETFAALGLNDPSKVQRIIYYNERIKTYQPSVPDNFNDMLSFEIGKGYLIFAKQDINIPGLIPPVSVGGGNVLPAPTGFSAQSLGQNEIGLVWQAVTNAIGYTIEKSETTNFFLPEKIVNNENKLDHIDTGLSASTQYYYRLYANTADGITNYAFTFSRTANPPPPPPTFNRIVTFELSANGTYTQGTAGNEAFSAGAVSANKKIRFNALNNPSQPAIITNVFLGGQIEIVCAMPGEYNNAQFEYTDSNNVVRLLNFTDGIINL